MTARIVPVDELAELFPHCVHCDGCEASAAPHEDPCDTPGCPGGQPIGGAE